jgi:predicted PurR-regulated permease PerM
MIVTICILSTLLIISAFIIVNLLRKLEKVDDELSLVSDQFTNLIQTLEQAVTKMREIDSKGWFESDDETGTVFKGINDLLTQIYNEWEIDNNERE